MNFPYYIFPREEQTMVKKQVKTNGADASTPMVAGRGHKTCVCGEVVASASRTCPKCQHEFVPKPKKTTTKTITASGDLKSQLLAERTRLLDLLKNKEKMEGQISAIDNLLGQM
jgi:hypothetical protein